VPDLSRELSRAPFELNATVKLLAEKTVMAVPPGATRVRALVSFLSDPKPQGLGLEYDWAVSANARTTLKLGRGDCVALATVLVGLGRGLGWPIFFAEARTGKPITHEFEEITVLSDHMVVVVLARSVRMVVDFLGLVEEGYDIRLIDDLTAYAHLINNVSGYRLLTVKSDNPEDPEDPEQRWMVAQKGFELATRIQPELGRAWNNLGIAYSRLGNFEDARSAYQRAVQLDTVFGSPERNLIIMETRASGETTLTEDSIP
jgi:tetratricopeptide (TPR) repeat protein